MPEQRMGRRQFMKMAGVASAVVTLPAALTGCAGRAAIGTGPRGQRGAHTTYFEAFGVHDALLRKVLARGLSRGGDFSEVFLQHTVSHWVVMEDGQVNRAYTEVALGAGIRVLKGDATGFAFSEDLADGPLLAAADTAATVADGSPSAVVKPLSVTRLPSRYAVDVPWTEVGIDRKLPLIERAERIARQRDSRIIKVSVYLEDSTSSLLVANSEGLLTEDTKPMAILSVSCVGQHAGGVETGGKSVSCMDSLRYFDAAVVQRLAQEAVDRTTLLFGAGSPPPGQYPVVLAPGPTGILLHEAIGHGMEADFNRKGVSIYADRIGKRVAPKGVTIVDDGTNLRMRGSINLDDEGTPGQRTVLVEDGILRSYLHDRISARHYHLASTGSGRRQSYRFAPVPRMRNTYMMPGTHPPEEIIASVKQGLYAEEFLNGQVNIGAGDFTFYLKHGRIIENGKLTRVVKDANLVGRGPAVLDAVELVGNNLELYSGGGYCGKDGQRIPVGFGLPTIRTGAISVGGRKS